MPERMKWSRVSDGDLRMLGQLSTRDESGRHFTEAYSWDWLDRMERLGMLEIVRPVHEIGMPYSREYWSVEVTEQGIDEGERRNWGRGPKGKWVVEVMDDEGEWWLLSSSLDIPAPGYGGTTEGVLNAEVEAASNAGVEYDVTRMRAFWIPEDGEE